MVEVFTIGGGEYIVNTFNAVAAWTGGGGYGSLIKVVMVIGLIYALLSVAFTLNFRVWMNWFLGSTLIYSCLMVPTVDVKVTDRINPSLAPATVANVPLGLGVIASFSSQVGDWLTRTAETVFTMPSQLNYSNNGMIYGSRLFDATRNFQIRDAEFATNLQNHYKNCVFGDVLLNFKSLTDLASSTDLWASIGPGSPARSQVWLERDGGGSVNNTIITCQVAYQALTGLWNTIIDASTPLWGRQTYTNLSETAAAAKLRQDVPIVNQTFTGSSSDYTSSMRQNSAINAFMQARDAMGGSTGGASMDAFATTRADIQARNTYNSIAQQAMSWVPILNIVLTVVFYAMFPVIFPLFLMPQTGVQALKGYVTGFFYLAAWGPLYVILHMICMTRAESASNAVSQGGLTLSSYAGIGAVNAETATIAGFMLMSVPFIAAGLARGAMSISGQATSILAPAQNAAEAAAVEQTTGNYSYGNTSFANLTSNMRQSNQWSDAPTFSTGASSFTVRNDNGSTDSFMADGSIITDVSGGMSKLAFSSTLNSSRVAEMRQQLSAVQRAARSEEVSAGHVTTAAHTDRSGRTISSESTHGSESANGTQSGENHEQFDRTSNSANNGIETRSGITDTSKVDNGVGRVSRQIDGTQGGVSAGFSGNGRSKSAQSSGGNGKDQGPGKKDVISQVKDALPSVSGSKNWTDNQIWDLSHNTGRTVTSDDASSVTDSMRFEHGNGDNYAVTDGSYSRGGSFARSARSSISVVGSDDSLTDAYSHENRLRQLNELAEQLSNDISYAESHNMQFSENLSQELAEWYRQEANRMPPGIAPELHQTTFTVQERQVRDAMISKFLDERSQAIWDAVGPEMMASPLNEIDPSAVSPDDASVRARYHPRGLAGVTTLSGPAGPGDASAKVEAGKQELQALGEAKRMMRAGYVSKGAAVQSMVNDDMDKGFFNDPNLRK
ncbi:conjugal transfer protein TraG N-terminal domain-containing protein [Novosphingobium guangzhouense]|uniref:Conjugal transfer protein TraG n=1 Tax=Novosphingobium guangzhouense TaxID=1850347 RepID=A0A2K2G2V8_9SPHN|nr:conjugal transfer protein TraG N-terminal domain-containing protein [Novosphingobium guangzhouense]PNU05366.1 conjugal transfer protein TraG [Novosphingobium guangzhouense]